MDGIDVGMSSIAPKCFCLCARDFIKCSYPDIRTCSKCRSECLNREAPKSKIKRLSLRDIGNLSGDRFQFVTQEDEKDLQKEFIPGNTQRATLWAMKVFGDWKKARKD